MPPSSSTTGFGPLAAAAITRRPVATEPVKVTERTSGWRTRASPASSPKPVTTLTTPAGRPASAAISASFRAVSGDCSAGLTTAAQPAASAGASERIAMPSGKFHGTMWAVTPIGSIMVKSTKAGPRGMLAPSSLSAAPAL